MEDGEVAVLTTGGIQVYNAMGKPIEKEHHRIDWEVSAAEIMIATQKASRLYIQVMKK